MSKFWGKKSEKGITLLLVLLMITSGCGQPKEGVSLANLTTTNQINADNSPVSSKNVFLSSTPAIYFTAKVIDATQNTVVEVKWRNATKDQVLATESFKGGRTKDRPQEFMVGLKPTTSYLYSKISLSGIGWSIGTYEIQAKLNGVEVGKLNYNIVADDDYDLINKRNLLKNLYLGSQINQDKQITVPSTVFDRDQEKIYASALFKDVPVGTTIRTVWKYLDGNREIDSFYTKFSGSGYLVFEISLEKFGRLWSDGLWPKGNFEVSLYVDNVLIITKNFTVS